MINETMANQLNKHVIFNMVAQMCHKEELLIKTQNICFNSAFLNFRTEWEIHGIPEDAWRRTTKPKGLSSVDGPLWPQITQS